MKQLGHLLFIPKTFLKLKNVTNTDKRRLHLTKHTISLKPFFNVLWQAIYWSNKHSDVLHQSGHNNSTHPIILWFWR